MQETSAYEGVSILDVLAVWPCVRAIFEHVPVRDLVRSERVSTRWQHAVHDYLSSCRKFKLSSGRIADNEDPDDLTIEIVDNKRPWTVLSKTVEKLGSFIVSLVTTCGEVEHLKLVEMNCPHLHTIEFCYIDDHENGLLNKFDRVFDSGTENFKELKNVLFTESHNMDELLLSQPLRKIGFESIEIEESETDGKFLNIIKSDNLKSLYLSNCNNLNSKKLESIASNLQNLTYLLLDNTNMEVLENIYQILIKTTKLEFLSLNGYNDWMMPWSKKQLIRSLSRLSYLKVFNMACNKNMDDELVEVIVRDCRKLERLIISPADSVTVRCLAALCSRRMPALTTLCVGYIHKYTTEDLMKFTSRPLIQELQALGVVKVTPQWVEATARASQGPKHIQVRMEQANAPDKTEQYQKELRITLDSRLHISDWSIYE